MGKWSIDKNTWHARWYFFSCRWWAEFTEDTYWAERWADTDLCSYIRMSLFGVPIILAAHLALALVIAAIPWGFIEWLGVSGAARGAVGVVGVTVVVGLGFAALAAVVWGGSAAWNQAGSAAQVLGQYAHDRMRGICRFVKVE